MPAVPPRGGPWRRGLPTRAPGALTSHGQRFVSRWELFIPPPCVFGMLMSEGKEPNHALGSGRGRTSASGTRGLEPSPHSSRCPRQAEAGRTERRLALAEVLDTCWCLGTCSEELSSSSVTLGNLLNLPEPECLGL